METTPYSEFLIWREYYETESERPTLDQHYLAAIVAEIRSLFASNRVPLEDAFIRFVKQERRAERTPEERAKLAEASKSVWLAFLNVKEGDGDG